MKNKFIYIFTVLIFTLLIYGCNPKTNKNKYKLVVVNGNEITTDLVKTIGGNFIDTNTAIRSGNDPHLYKVKEKDIIRITDSSLIIYNGANLEGRLEWALNKIGNITPAISIKDSIPKHKLIYDKDTNRINPHFWHDVSIWKKTTSYITDNLTKINPVNEMIYRKNEDIYLYVLNKLENDIKKAVAQIPKNKRILVTDHNSLAYFGKAYGFETLSLQGINTADEVSSDEINAFAELLYKRKIDTMFLEASLPERNMRLVQSTLKSIGHNIKIGGILYTDTLGAGNDYESMMRHNIKTIVNGLK